MAFSSGAFIFTQLLTVHSIALTAHMISGSKDELELSGMRDFCIWDTLL